MAQLKKEDINQEVLPKFIDDKGGCVEMVAINEDPRCYNRREPVFIL